MGPQLTVCALEDNSLLTVLLAPLNTQITDLETSNDDAVISLFVANLKSDFTRVNEQF